MLKNKTVVITGGAGLLGKEFTKAILAHAGSVIIADLDIQKGNSVVKELDNGEKLIKSYPLDITSEKSIQKLISFANDNFGKIDAWVNNAYPRITNTKGNKQKREYSDSFFDIEYENLCESFSLNIGGYFLCSQKIASYFLKQGYGNIINVSSIYGVIPPRFQIYDKTKMTMPLDYGLNKSAIIYLTKYLAKYLKGKNIKVNTLSPGGIFNNQPDSFVNEYAKFAINKGILDREDISGALVFLLSDYSKFINGQNIIVDDGWTL